MISPDARIEKLNSAIRKYRFRAQLYKDVLGPDNELCKIYEKELHKALSDRDWAEQIKRDQNEVSDK